MANTGGGAARKFVESGPVHEKLKDLISPRDMTEKQEIQGTYEGYFEAGEPNERGERGKIYKLRLDNGDLVGIGGCAQLDKRLGIRAVGTYVQLIYGGKKKISSNGHKNAGKSSHLFTVNYDESSVPASNAMSAADADDDDAL